MPFLDKVFKEKPKTPSEVVTKLTTALEALAGVRKDERGLEKAQESVAKYLGFAKLLLFGDDEHEPTKENAIALAQEAGRSDLLSLIVKQLVELDFESRKDAAQVFGALVRIRENEERGPGAHYILNHPEIPTLLFNGWVRRRSAGWAASAAGLIPRVRRSPQV
jgi:calcium binding protein 39